MKKRLNILIILVSSLGLLFTSCKKYGYKFDDGYEFGEDKANMAGGQSDTLKNDFSKIDIARSFPGLMSASEPRLKNVDVTIDFTKRFVPTSDIKIASTPQPLYSTGLYAPAGEPIEFDVPSAVDGVVAMIGGWTDNLSGINPIKRDPIIYNQVSLKAGKNYIRNLYGGTIYLRTNGVVKNLSVVTVKISGAAKSPDFILGETSDASWNDMVKTSTVPWFQLRGKRIIFELPKFLLDKHPILNPTALMEEWDKIIDLDIYDWKGMEVGSLDSLNRTPELPIRVIMDVQPRLTYAHNAFPIVMQLDENLFVNEITSYNNLITKGAWRTMFEIGRNNNTYFWLWNAISGTAGNLFSLKGANRKSMDFQNLNPNMRLAVDTGLWYVKQPKSFTANFNKDISYRTNGDLIKLVPFMQLFETYGYDLMTFVEKKARLNNLQVMSDQQKINFFYTNASEFTSTDLSAFFRAWGIFISPEVTDTVASRYPYLSKSVYNYNPITKIGGTDSVPPPPRELDRVSWTVVSFCCQESDSANSYASKLLDGEIGTSWHSKYILGGSLETHSPHYITFDMGKVNKVAGFWYVNGASIYRPKDIAIALSADNMEWEEVYVGPGFNTGSGVFNQADFAAVYPSVRYVRFQLTTSYQATTDNRVSTAEFGLLGPKIAQLPK